jgi:hypothetical protein
MKTTVDNFVITEEDTSQEEAALKMAASGIVDINQFWQRIKEFKLPLDISPEGKLRASHLSTKLKDRTRDITLFPPRVQNHQHHHSPLYRSFETDPFDCLPIPSNTYQFQTRKPP